MADELNNHLAGGGTVIVTTHMRATEYSKKHAGWFSMTSKGDLQVNHGRGNNCLSIGNRLLVSVRLYA